MSHVGVVDRLLWMQGEFPLGVGDVVLQKTPVSFDVSVWELFSAVDGGWRGCWGWWIRVGIVIRCIWWV